MKTLIINADCIPSKIPIGHVGENVVEAIQFNYADWEQTYGAGTLSMILQRPEDVVPYPVSMTDGLYVFTNTDLAYQGIVRAQLIYTVDGEAVKKSDIFLLYVDQSLGEAGDAPDPYDSWIDDIVAAKDQAEAAAETAEAAATEATRQADLASGSATAAAESATEASGHAQAALGYRDQAESYKDIASQKATEAAGSATEASGSASRASASETQAVASATAAANSATASAQSATESASSATASAQSATEASEYAEQAQQTAEEFADEISGLKEDLNQIQTDLTDEISARESADTAINAALSTKAEIDGTYEAMTVGNAEQLLSDNYTEDSEPYIFRKSVSGDREFDEIVGGTIAWNQLAKNIDTITVSGITLTNNGDGFYTLNGTATAIAVFALASVTPPHVYFVDGCTNGDRGTFYIGNSMSGYVQSTVPKMYKSSNIVNVWYIAVANGATVTNAVVRPQILDLTAMFGSTIADYIYSLEIATAGAGVAWFKKLFPKPYYEYNPGELKSITGLVSHDTIGFNQWDEEWENGAIVNGANVVSPSTIRGTHYMPCIGGVNYFIKSPANVFLWFYDADKNYLSPAGGTNVIITAPNNARFFRVSTSPAYPSTYNNDISINISDPTKNGTYEPYKKRSYPLDSSLTLRGIPKLAANKLYNDGDVYEANGIVTRRFKRITGSEMVLHNTSSAGYKTYKYTTSGESLYKINGVVFSNITRTIVSSLNSSTVSEECIQRLVSGTSIVFIAISPNRDISEVDLIYELATPTTETAKPFQSPQICSEYGTEEYIYDSEAFPVPVGHITKYPDNLRKKLDGLPWDLSMIAPVETGTTASKAYTIGQYFLLNNQFCKAKTAIASGATFTLNTNYTVTTVADELYSALHSQ